MICCCANSLAAMKIMEMHLVRGLLQSSREEETNYSKFPACGSSLLDSNAPFIEPKVFATVALQFQTTSYHQY